MKNEAIKRGFKDGVHVKYNFKRWVKNNILYHNDFQYKKDENEFLYGGVLIFRNGQWAEIVKTYTKQEAEKLLNGKII